MRILLILIIPLLTSCLFSNSFTYTSKESIFAERKKTKEVFTLFSIKDSFIDEIKLQSPIDGSWENLDRFIGKHHPKNLIDASEKPQQWLGKEFGLWPKGATQLLYKDGDISVWVVDSTVVGIRIQTDKFRDPERTFIIGEQKFSSLSTENLMKKIGDHFSKRRYFSVY